MYIYIYILLRRCGNLVRPSSTVLRMVSAMIDFAKMVSATVDFARMVSAMVDFARKNSTCPSLCS